QALRIDPGYNSRNEMTSLTRFSDVAGTSVLGTTAYSLYDAGRVTSIVNKNASAATLSYYNYAFDNADRVTSETWSSAVGTFTYSGSHTYTYDSTNQLTGDGASTYTYSFNGNRTMAGYATGADNR